MDGVPRSNGVSAGPLTAQRLVLRGPRSQVRVRRTPKSPMRPKVFHLLTRMLVGGGAEFETLEMVSRLRERFDFCVGFGPGHDQAQVEVLRGLGVQTRVFSSLLHLNLPSLVPAALQVRRFLRREHFDIVHTHNTEAGLVGRWAAWSARVPIVVHSLHGDVFVGRSRWKVALLSVLERWMARRTDRFFSNAGQITDTYLSRAIGRPDQFVTIRTGICLEAFREAEPAQLPVSADALLVLTVARVVRDKGYSELAEAAAGVLRAATFPVVFVVVGQGEYLQTFRQRIDQLGLAEKFLFISWLSQAEMASIARACHIFALPSYREGIPRVLVEAMAAGLAPIATNVGGVSEVVRSGQNGILIRPRESKELEQALLALVQDEQLRRRLARQAACSVEEFEANEVAKRVGDEYSGLLSRFDAN